jgi:hypothetical protein
MGLFKLKIVPRQIKNFKNPNTLRARQKHHPPRPHQGKAAIENNGKFSVL